MTQARLRMTILSLWIAFWIISTIALILSPWMREDIARTEILPAIFSISGIWIPPLTCLAAFWFPQEEQKVAKLVSATRERIYAAIGLTVSYLTFVLVLIVWSVYLIESNQKTLDPGRVTLLGQIDESVRIALLVSPIALGPINWLTGGGKNHNDGPIKNTGPNI